MIFKVSALIYTLSNEMRVTRTSKFLAQKAFPSKLCHKKKDDNGALVVIVLIFLQDKKISITNCLHLPYSVYQFVGIPSLPYYNYNKNNECDH